MNWTKEPSLRLRISHHAAASATGLDAPRKVHCKKLGVHSFGISLDGYGAGLVDELHLAQSPVLLGSENLFSGLDLAALSYRCVERVPSAKTTHLILKKT